jgi:mRNA interferase RelE/StbE
MARYRVLFKPSAEKALRQLPISVQKRIVAAVDGLQDNPRPPGAVKLTAEPDLWRIRVGDYRVIYSIDDERLIILVVRITHRKDVYRR